MKKKTFYFVVIFTVLYFVISFVTKPDDTLISRTVEAFIVAIISLIGMRSFDKKLRIKLLGKDTYLGSEIISQGLINHRRGIIADGGAGYLLNDRFVFHPHKLNVSTKDLTILLSEIEQVQSYKIMFFHTGLKIILKSGKVEKFVIDKTSELYKSIIT